MHLSSYRVKVIGKPIGGNNEPPIDGDNDQICREGEPGEGPCPPDAIKPNQTKPGTTVTRVSIDLANPGAGRWDKQSNDKFQRRREALDRKESRRKTGRKPKPISSDDMLRAMEDGEVSSEEFIDRIKAMFEFDMLGQNNARSVVQGAFVAGGNYPEIAENPDNLLYNRPALLVHGVFELPDGRKIGAFQRTIFPEEETVKNELMEISIDQRGSGVGGDFTAESEDIYREAGFRRVKVTAGMSDGPFVWAAKGFDWERNSDREQFLDTLEVEVLLEEERLNFDEELQYFESKEEIDRLLKLIEEARGQRFDTESRIKPIDFTFSAGVRKILTDPKIRKRGWNGVKYL